MQKNIVMGVDVGASGVKGGLVNVKEGKMITERHRIETPKPATPKAMANVFAELVQYYKWTGPVGCGFPAIVHHGVARSAANIDRSWIGVNIERIFGQAIGAPVYALNDADAAGLATMRHGIGKGEAGTVIMLTIGSGLGSALFIDGELVPNSEFGHVYLKGQKEVAERYASNNARKYYNLEWDDWGKRFNEYLHHLDRLLSPDLVILGGGASKSFDLYEKQLDVPYAVRPAALQNRAGTVGAAMYALEREKKAKKKKEKSEKKK